MKERMGMTDIRKQANRLNFGEIEADAYQDDLGFSMGTMKKGGKGSGGIRALQVNKATNARMSQKLQRQLAKQQQVVRLPFPLWDSLASLVLLPFLLPLFSSASIFFYLSSASIFFYLSFALPLFCSASFALPLFSSESLFLPPFFLRLPISVSLVLRLPCPPPPFWAAAPKGPMTYDTTRRFWFLGSGLGRDEVL